jgi:rare lipoprotein A
LIGRAAECSLLAPATTHTGRGPFEHRRLLAAGFAGVLLLVGCGGPRPKTDGPPGGSVDFSRIPDALPRVEPLSRYGNRPTYEVLGHTYRTLPSSEGYVERGIASWYGTKFHGRPTSSMEPYDLYAMTAAHRSLPLPSYVEVRNLENGRRVVVKVNDRGPFHPNRIIDLSYAAAGKLGILDKGTGLVELRAIDPQHPGSAPSTTEATTRTAPGERAGSRPPSPSRSIAGGRSPAGMSQ